MKADSRCVGTESVSVLSADEQEVIIGGQGIVEYASVPSGSFPELTSDQKLLVSWGLMGFDPF